MSETGEWRHRIGECERMPHRCNNCTRAHVAIELPFRYVVYSAYGDTLLGVFDNAEDAREFAINYSQRSD